MVCPPQDRLVQLALRLEVEDVVADHVEGCGNCRAKLNQFTDLVDQLELVHDRLRRDHDELRGRLLANLPVVERQPAVGRQNTLLSFRRLNMKQRIALTLACVVAVAGLMIGWEALTARPVSAMERMRESVRKAESCRSTVEFETTLRPGGEPESSTLSSTYYWRESGSIRIEMKGDGDLWYINSTYILPADGPRIELEHTNREFRRGAPSVETDLSAERDLLGFQLMKQLESFPDEADRVLGTRDINGRRTEGFEIDTRKLAFEDFIGEGYFGVAQIWIDAETNLPIELSVGMKNPRSQERPITAMSASFDWNVELNDSLFEPIVPGDYLDENGYGPTPEEQGL